MSQPTTHEVTNEVEIGAQARVGQTLRDKWTLDRLIGVGGMASVYAATHRNGNRVAVKILHPELSTLATLRARFLREGYAANAVGHPGAVRVLDDDQTSDGAVFLVMELLEGISVQSLAAHRPGGRLSAAEVATIGDQLLDVLVAAHAQNILHRDLKPENLFITNEGRVKVLDFGIARMRGEPGAGRATATGTVMGTPAFMPPEQAKGLNRDIAAQTDLWAVGATMFFLLTGQVVHEAETASLELLAAMTAPSRAIRTVDSSLPAALAEVVDRALQYEIGARWPDARTMQQALRQAFPARVDLATVAAAPALASQRSGYVPVAGTSPTSGSWPDLGLVASAPYGQGDAPQVTAAGGALAPQAAPASSHAVAVPTAYGSVEVAGSPRATAAPAVVTLSSAMARSAPTQGQAPATSDATPAPASSAAASVGPSFAGSAPVAPLPATTTPSFMGAAAATPPPATATPSFMSATPVASPPATTTPSYITGPSFNQTVMQVGATPASSRRATTTLVLAGAVVLAIGGSIGVYSLASRANDGTTPGAGEPTADPMASASATVRDTKAPSSSEDAAPSAEPTAAAPSTALATAGPAPSAEPAAPRPTARTTTGGPTSTTPAPTATASAKVFKKW